MNLTLSFNNRVLHAIFYMHQTSDVCAGMCVYDHTHQMEKTAKFRQTVAVAYDDPSLGTSKLEASIYRTISLLSSITKNFE